MANALMLPVEAAGSSEPQSISGLPGRWVPGVAYLPSALGLSEDEAKSRVEGSPVVWVEVADEAGEGESAPAEASFPVEGVQAGTGFVRVEKDGPDGKVSANPSWVDQQIATATALGNGETPVGPHELNQREQVGMMSKSELQDALDAADVAYAANASKDALAAKLLGTWFPGTAEAEVEVEVEAEEPMTDDDPDQAEGTDA